jgi:hypothetical protein
MKVKITADHPIFKRFDKVVNEDEVSEVIAELMHYNYDNIETKPINEVTVVVGPINGPYHSHL